jgi:hypothetical protein
MRHSRSSPWLTTTLVLCAVLFLGGAAFANPSGGSATLGFANGTTLSGHFTFDLTSHTVTDWSFDSEAFSGGRLYSSASADFHSASIIAAADGSKESIFFEQRFNTGMSNEVLGGLQIIIDCFGTANCMNFGAPNLAFQTIGGLKGDCFNENECLPEVNLNAGILNVTDPPANTIAFNVDSTIAPGFTLYQGGTGPTGGGGTVPEPSSFVLLGGAAIALFERVRRQRLNKQ